MHWAGGLVLQGTKLGYSRDVGGATGVVEVVATQSIACCGAARPFDPARRDLRMNRPLGRSRETKSKAPAQSWPLQIRRQTEKQIQNHMQRPPGSIELNRPLQIQRRHQLLRGGGTPALPTATSTAKNRPSLAASGALQVHGFCYYVGVFQAGAGVEENYAIAGGEEA